jgi:intraflagellar transport protein 80
MVDCFQWNEECNILAAVMDGKFVAWYYPGALFIDEDVLEYTKVEKDAR